MKLRRPDVTTSNRDSTLGADIAGSATVEKIGTLAALRLRDFRLLWIGSTLSNAAQWIQQLTLGWLVYDLTGSGTMLGTINLVRSSTALGTAPLVGVMIDRLSRRMLMLATKGWLLVISLVLGLVLLSGRSEVWYLFVFTVFGGLAQAIDMPLRQTVIFDLVPRALAPNAVALIQTGWGLMRSLGPAVGGFFILWFGPGGNFLVQAGAYALIAVSIWWIHFPARKSEVRRSTPMQNLSEGLRYIVRERETRTFMMMGWILPLFIIPNFTILPPIYAKDVFHGGPEVLGYILSAVGVGGIVGGVVTASLGRLERRGLLQLAALLLLSLSMIGFAFSPTLWVALVFLATAGCFELIYLTTNQTLLQLSIPDQLRGRITSVISMSSGLGLMGALFVGVAADLWGPRATTAITSSVAVGMAVLVFLGSPTVRDYRLSRAITPDAASKRAGSSR